jgi:dipeptidyl aminopeptidase/acylaminoacyl peptidase
MIRAFLAAGVAACALVPVVATAATAEEMAAKLGAREYIRSISLSPEGKQVVIVTPQPSGGEAAVVINLETAKSTSILGSEGRDQQIAYCQFVLESRVICTLLLSTGSTRDIERATRLVSLSPDGKDMKQLTARTPRNAYFFSNYGGGIIDYNASGDPDAVLMERAFSPEVQTGGIAASNDQGLAVEQVNVTTLQRKIVERPKGTAQGYITDGLGNVRVMETRRSDSQGIYARLDSAYSYRDADGDTWKPLSAVNYDGSMVKGFQPLAVDGKANVVYGFATRGNFQGLYKMALDGSGTETAVLKRDDTDVDGLIQIGRNQRVVGASYATEKRVVEYFDPELKALSVNLAKALGNDMQVYIADSTRDEKKLLVFAGSDTKPGSYYIYDKGTRQLGLLLPARPELAGMQFGEMKPITYPAADGTMIPAYLTLPPGSDGKNIPAIVMPHGGPDARDEWGFDWLVQYFASRGFAVLQPQYRGSAGYGNDWFKGNAFQSWKSAIDDINDAGRWLEKSGVAAPGKIAIFGWSYGGYAALQSAVVDPDLFKAIVAVAPVTDLDVLRGEHVNDYNYKFVDAQIGNGPYIAEASPARHADRFKVPVLLVHGDNDTNVGVGESRLMNDKLKAAGKKVQYIEFKGLTHQLDDTAARTQMLVAAEKTIRQGLGLGGG